MNEPLSLHEDFIKDPTSKPSISIRDVIITCLHYCDVRHYLHGVATYYLCHSGLVVGLAHENLGPNPDALHQVF